MILIVIILIYLIVRYEIRIDYTKERNILLWYTYKKKRKYLILW